MEIGAIAQTLIILIRPHKDSFMFHVNNFLGSYLKETFTPRLIALINIKMLKIGENVLVKE